MSFPALVEPAAELSIDEVRRYSRHLIIPDVGMAGQKRLKNAKVLVIGAGGLGSPALLYLAAAGVGTLGIAEFDEVDESNLQRQIIHGMSDIGRPKAESAKESIAEVNPYVEVVVHNERLDNDNVLQVFEGYDLIVDGTDNFATRYMVNDAAYFLGIPYVWGSIYRFDGQASRLRADPGRRRPVLPLPLPRAPAAGHGPQLRRGRRARRAVRQHRLDPGQRGDQADHRHRRPGRSASSSSTTPSSWSGASSRSARTPTARCAVTNPTVTGLIDYDAFCGAVSDEAAEAAAGSTISVTQLEVMLKEREEGTRDFVLIDVREPNEFEINRIPGAVLIPKGEFLNGNALGELPSDKPVVLHCKSGVRSAEVLAIVKGAGYADAVHVGGGVVAWVNQIDPSQPAY